VVAADSLRSPQLLFASGLGTQALGHYLNEHPYISAVIRTTDTDADTEERRDNVPPPSGVTWVPFADETFPFHFQLTQRQTRIDLGLFLPKTRHFENRVGFSRDAVDFYGMPAMNVRYSLSPRDVALVDRARTIPLEVARALGAQLRGDPVLLPNGSSLHYQGTVRMGPEDDGTSVCDTTSRVWGTDNVYVAGNGVIPTSAACNPTLTSVALAVIGARAIAQSVAA
jgi:choline dehydrogenase-like flavoprotein